jgi:hypothetical protein
MAVVAAQRRIWMGRAAVLAIRLAALELLAGAVDSTGVYLPPNQFFRSGSPRIHLGRIRARMGYRIRPNVVVDALADGTLGPGPIRNTVHAGVAVRNTF